MFATTVRDVRTIQPSFQQQCGANRILSVNFRVSDIHTIQQQGQTTFFQHTFANRMCVRDSATEQQCGVNRFRSVNFCEHDAHTISDYTGARSGRLAPINAVHIHIMAILIGAAITICLLTCCRCYYSQ